MRRVRSLSLVVLSVLLLGGCGSAAQDRHRAGTSAPAGERQGGGGPDRRGRFDVVDPDRGGSAHVHNPSAEAYEDRAYPKTYITAEQTLAARQAYERLPLRLRSAAFRRGVLDAAASAQVGADWQALGPAGGFAPGPTTESLRDSITSGRITAMAIAPNCSAGACRLWIAAAGGGVWRTDDALAQPPTWTAVDNGLLTDNLGSLTIDPNDPTGNTIYAGSGEANAINEAGLGLFKSTDGGDHWALVPGSEAVAKDRAIGAIRIPRQPGNQTIWIGTALGRNGQASTNGGAAEPPGAPELGVYESTDGGATFTKQFSQPQDFYLGGVTDIELDPSDPTTVWASLLGYGVWRSQGGGQWEQVFVPENPDGDDRVELALTRLPNGKTRAYAMDGGTDANTGEPTGDFFRVDDANVSAGTLVGPNDDNSGWTKLSSSVDGTPGFSVYHPCQFQCSYDMFLEVDPSDPNTVWEGGSMVYEEIRPLQDPSLRGLASNRSNGRAVMRSTDAGVHWTDMTADTQTPHYEQMHPDQHALVFDPANPSIAIIGSDGGIVRTDGAYDDSSSQCATREGVADSQTDLADCRAWLSAIPHQIVNMNEGLATLQFVDLAVDPRDPNGDLLGGTQDNGTFAFAPYTPGAPRSWFESVNGDGSASGFDASDPNVRVHTFFLGLFDVNHRGADPNFWTFISQPIVDSGERTSFYTPMRTDPVASGTIFAGAQHVWRTQDDGGPQPYLEKYCLGPGGVPTYDPAKTKCGDFEAIGADLTDPSLGDRTDGADYVVRVERAPSDRSTLWVAGRRGRLFVSKNADAPAHTVEFDRIDKGSSPNRFPSGIAIDPADANHAYISYSGYAANTPSTPGHVYDVHYDPATHGATFTDLSYDLADQPITALALDSYTGDLYGGTDTGVVRLPAGATSWERAANGLPAVTTPGLNLQPAGRVLYAATYGRSVYKLALAPGARIASAGGVPEGSTIVLDGSQSAAFAGAPLTYSWTLPDGTTASGPTVAWKAVGQGLRTVTLTVTAPDGRSGTTTKPLAVTAPVGGGGGNPPPPSGRVKLTSHSRRLSSKVHLNLLCPKTQTLGCAGRVSVTVKRGRRTITLGSAAFAVLPGHTAHLTFRVSKATRKRLGKHKKSLRATVTIKQLKPGGSTSVIRRTIKLRR